jgi:hypothetical protein
MSLRFVEKPTEGKYLFREATFHCFQYVDLAQNPIRPSNLVPRSKSGECTPVALRDRFIRTRHLSFNLYVGEN